MKRFLPVLALALVALPVAAATIAPPEYRECMKQAIERRERGYIDSLLIFNDDQTRALEERRVRYVEAYDAETDSEIRERLRDADKHYARATRAAKELRKDRDDDVRDAYNDDRDVCKDIRRDIEHPPRRRGPSFGDCPVGRVCIEPFGG